MPTKKVWIKVSSQQWKINIQGLHFSKWAVIFYHFKKNTACINSVPLNLNHRWTIQIQPRIENSSAENLCNLIVVNHHQQAVSSSYMMGCCCMVLLLIQLKEGDSWVIWFPSDIWTCLLQLKKDWGLQKDEKAPSKVFLIIHFEAPSLNTKQL